MADWEKRIGAMTLFVPDLDRARQFYQDVFGLDEARKGAGQFAIIVGDVDAVCSELAGIKAGDRIACRSAARPGSVGRGC
jgi:catechol 2,3-dioxygenase-like lactoylglutathione lyase family enzyme